MNSRIIPRAAAAVAACALLAACGTKGGRDDYARDADTGAAAPATMTDASHPSGPDSTAGVSNRTGTSEVAGDKQGQRGTAAIPNTPAAGAAAAANANATTPQPVKRP